MTLFSSRCLTADGARGDAVVLVESRCPFSQSQCRSGECISSSQFCDGNPQCLDSSDEFPIFCQSKIDFPKNRSSLETLLNNGHRIVISYIQKYDFPLSAPSSKGEQTFQCKICRGHQKLNIFTDCWGCRRSIYRNVGCKLKHFRNINIVL